MIGRFEKVGFRRKGPTNRLRNSSKDSRVHSKHTFTLSTAEKARPDQAKNASRAPNNSLTKTKSSRVEPANRLLGRRTDRPSAFGSAATGRRHTANYDDALCQPRGGAGRC